MGHIAKLSSHKPSIFQGALDFSAARSKISLTVEHPYERPLVRTLLAVLGGLACAYLYFVGASVLDIIERNEMAAESATLQSSIATKEQEYYVLSHTLDESSALAVGLTPIADTHYVHAPSNATAATIGSDAR